MSEQYLTVERLTKFVPKGTSTKAIKAIYEEIKRTQDHEYLVQEDVEEKFLSSLHLMGKQGVTLEKVLNAVKFCTLKLRQTNRLSWEIVFPDKVKSLEEKYSHRGEKAVIDKIDAASTTYNSSMLVTELSKTMMIPLYIQMQPEVLKSAQSLIKLRDGIDANGKPTSGNVQMLSALAIIDKFSMPEELQINMTVDVGENTVSVMDQIMNKVGSMADVQMAQLASGRTIDEVQKLGIDFTDVEVVRDD